MADLFDEILKQASNNTKDASKELKKIDRTVEQQKRLKAEREAQERKLTKEAVKKNVSPPPKPKFCIPKLSASKKTEPTVDKDRLTAFLRKKEEEKRKEFLEKRNEKEKLIKLRLQTYGGKANKKLAKQFGTTPIELQQKYGTDRDHEEYLRRLQMREEEEADRLNTELRGSVMKALERKKVVDKIAPSVEERKAKGPYRVASNKQNSLRYFTKEDSPVPTALSSKSKLEDKSKRPSVLPNKKLPPLKNERKKPAPAFDFMDLMRKACSGLFFSQPNWIPPAEAIQKGEPISQSPPHMSVQKEQVGTSEKGYEKSLRRNADDSFTRKNVNRQAGSNNTNAPSQNDRYGKKMAQSTNKYGIGTVKKLQESSSSSSSNSKGRPEKATSSSSSKDLFRKPMGSAPRSDGRQFSSSRTSASSTPQTSAALPPKRYLPGDLRYKPDVEQRPGPLPSTNRNEFSSTRERASTKPDPRASSKPDLRIATKLPNDRKRSEEASKNYDSPVQKKGKLDEDAARARHREYMRYKQMRQEQMRRRREEEEVEDEEYDSDLDSFIDDSEFDELSRKDFEETLRMVNPRYNKKRWALNERLIDDRFMEAKYRDVAREEMRSAKIGLLEDLREAQRGASIAL